MTTLTEFDTALSGLSVTGVTRAYTYQALSVNTPDLPASFTRTPGAGIDYGLETCSGNSLSLEYVIVMEPLGQETQSVNHVIALTMIDNLKTALDTLYTASMFTWSARIDIETVGGLQHWVIVTSAQLAE